MDTKEARARKAIIETARRLYDRGLAVAKSGNLSVRLDEYTILITASGTSFKDLQKDGIVRVNLRRAPTSVKPPSSELALHSRIYKDLGSQCVLHAHPPLTNGYFAVHDQLKPLTFESELYIGKLAVIKQQTPTVTDPHPVVKALKVNHIVVLKNHGVVSISDSLAEALDLVEALEEAVKTAALAHLFKEKLS